MTKFSVGVAFESLNNLPFILNDTPTALKVQFFPDNANKQVLTKFVTKCVTIQCNSNM